MTRASVIVPVHGREALTRRCLEAVLPGLPAGCEVVVVDDASPDRTAELLSGYGEAIRVVSLAANGGFSRACNAGAAAARGELLVFLNNDTEPRAGWLEALLGHAAREPRAAIVGARLLYPNGTVQHAGVAFGQDGYPHNLYAGLPGDHPAASRPRRLQAVTGACMLVRRWAFEALGGFDEGYANSLEDVDLCLRAGETGEEVHYCPEAVVVHLESASRGRSDRFERSVALYRERWRERVRRDDLEIYAADGLLGVEYPASFPLRLSVSPLLASVDDAREAGIEGLLESYAGQVSDLLAEVMRLTALAGDAADAGEGAGSSRLPEKRRRSSFPGHMRGKGRTPTGFRDHEALLAEARRLEAEARALQERLGVPRGGLGYRHDVELVREAVAGAVPPGASVLVVSRGDRELVRLEGREASHFPQGAGGGYLGHHPGDSEEAIDRLEELRRGGAEFLVLPAASYWWLDHYEGFARHLAERCEATDLGACTVFRLAADRSPVGGAA